MSEPAKGIKFLRSILAPPTDPTGSEEAADLSIASGVLIHINPDSLSKAYESLYALSKKFILVSEYFNPLPVAIPFVVTTTGFIKRYFAGELWAQYLSLRLVDYGFIWSKDPVALKDDATWFLFEK